MNPLHILSRLSGKTVPYPIMIGAFLSVLSGFYAFAQLPLVSASEDRMDARFQSSVLPATGRQETILETAQFGRYAVLSKSSQGTALQVIGRMAGPGTIQGIPGERDGRVDLFLDRGTYKVVTFSHEKGTGEVTLEAHSFQEQNPKPAPILEKHKIIQTSLDDLQRRSYWLDIQKREVVYIETAGRNLADLRLWKDGSWLVDIAPTGEEIEPQTGKPLNALRMAADLNPGLYLLIAYGGPSKPWSETSNDHPFYVRSGIPQLGMTGRRYFTTSPFGVDRWLVPRRANYFRLELPKAEDAALEVSTFDEKDPFSISDLYQEITKNSLPPVAEITTSGYNDGFYLVNVRREAGKGYVLQHFEYKKYYPFDGTGDYWLSTTHSGYGEDSVDASALLTERYRNQRDTERLYQKSLIELDKEKGWRRRVNLIDPLTMYLHVDTRGEYVVEGRGVEALFRVEPFLISRPRDYRSPPFHSSGHVWDLDRGIYVLTVEPMPDGRGIMDLMVHHEEVPAPEESPAQTSIRFPRITLDMDKTYTLYMNEQPGVKAGLVLRPLPIDLTEPLPVTQKSHETLEISIKVPEAGVVSGIGEDGGLMDIAVMEKPNTSNKPLKGVQWVRGLINPDHGPDQWEKTLSLEAGEYFIYVRNPSDHIIQYSLLIEPTRLASDTPLRRITDASLKTLPQFPVLSRDHPMFLNVDRHEKKTFIVKVDRPALYRLESIGLLETEGNIRTRVNPSLDRQRSNGVGRNFLIQQFFREGEYQLTVSPQGDTKGRMGIQLAETDLHDGGILSDNIPAPYSLAAGQGIAYRFHIKEKGVYTLEALGLNRDFRMRLEDENGWPVTTPGGIARLEREFSTGAYRMVILPQPVQARVVARLKSIPAQAKTEGHGPHVIPFHLMGKDIHHVWEEPREGDQRLPDTWCFTVPAPTETVIRLSREMTGDLVRMDGQTQSIPLSGRKPWSGSLEKGDYCIKTQSIRKNNQLEYFLNVDIQDLVDGLSREITAPAEISVSVGKDGAVEISSFGDEDVSARLYHTGDRLIARSDDGEDNWNFHLAQNLVKGKYRLKIDPIGKEAAQTMVSMYVPPEIQEKPISLPAHMTIKGDGVHLYPLQIPKDKECVVISAHSTDNLLMAIEQKDQDQWKTLGASSGKAPLVAVVLSTVDDTPCRLQIQSIDHRGSPIQLRAAVMSPSMIHESDLIHANAPLKALPDLDLPMGIISITLESPGLFEIMGPPTKGLFYASGPGQSFVPCENNLAMAGSTRLWIMAGTDRKATFQIRGRRIQLSHEPLSLTIPPQTRLWVGNTPFQGTCLVMAESRVDQPVVVWLDPPETFMDIAGMGVGQQSAVAVTFDPGRSLIGVWNAGDLNMPFPVHVTQYNFAAPMSETLGMGIIDAAIEPDEPHRFMLPDGLKRIQLVMPKATAAVLETMGVIQSVQWSGNESISRTVDTEADTLTLLHTADRPIHVGVILSSIPREQSLTKLTSKDILKQTFSVSGSFETAIQLSDQEKMGGNLVLHLLGASVEGTLKEQNGRIRRGETIHVKDDAALTVSHGPGLVMAWLENGDMNPWHELARENLFDVQSTGSVPLKGNAMTLVFQPETPTLLHVRTFGPVIVSMAPQGVPLKVMVAQEGADIPVYGSPDLERRISLQAVNAGLLAGTVDCVLSDITPISEGPGPKQMLEPGGSRIFSFHLSRPVRVGIGVKASSDIATCTLMDAAGRILGTGVVQMHDLETGTYLMIIQSPPQGLPVEVQPVLVGITPRGTEPPEDVIQKYLAGSQ